MGTEEWEGQQDCYDGSNGEASGDKEDEAKPEVASVFFETREARVNSSQVNRITCFSSTLKARLGASMAGIIVVIPTMLRMEINSKRAIVHMVRLPFTITSQPDAANTNVPQYHDDTF